MKSFLLLFLLLAPFSPSQDNVFICGSKGAKKYHFNENCRGLKSCSNEVVKTSLKQAQRYGLTLCGWED